MSLILLLSEPVSTSTYLPEIYEVDVTHPTAVDLSDGQIQIGARGGIPPYQYSIDGVNFFSSPLFSSLTEGTYTLYLADAETGTDTESVTLIARTKLLKLMIDILKTLLSQAGCTFVMYESEQISDIAVSPVTPEDIVGLLKEPEAVTFETKGNAVSERYPTMIVEILKMVRPEDTAENNLATLDLTRAVANRFIYEVISSGEFKKFPDVAGIKITEQKYDANLLGWSLSMELFQIANRLKC